MDVHRRRQGTKNLLGILVAGALTAACGPKVSVSEELGSAAWCNPMQVTYPENVRSGLAADSDNYYWQGEVIVSGVGTAIDAAVADSEQNVDLLDSFSFAESERVGSLADFEVRLYGVPDGATVLGAVAAINDAAIAEPEAIVFAEPNYISSPAPHGTFGSPESIPTGASTSPWAQWALGSPEGVGLFNADGTIAVEGGAGASVVVVFDTSPFEEEGLWTIVRPEDTFDVCVSLPKTPYMRSRAEAPGKDLNEHGLFVAGLIHQVNPLASIHLIRVLDDEAMGDTFYVAEAIKAVLSHLQPLQVINLSLGVHIHEDTQALLADSSELISRFEALGLPIRGAGGETPLVSLRLAVLAALEKSALVVASAGNDSACDEVMPMQYPALWADVLGVGASNETRGRSCFSNHADILAPGEVIIGPVTSSCWASGYALWDGTSFSAPLVSGLAALLLGQSLDPTQIAEIIVNGGCGAAAPSEPPVINVPEALLAATSCP